MWLLLLLSVKSTRSEFMDQQLLIWLNWEIKQTPDDHQHHHRAHKSTVIVVLCVVQDGKSWWGCLVLIYAGFNLFISYCRWHWGVGEGCGRRSSSIKPPIHPSIDRSAHPLMIHNLGLQTEYELYYFYDWMGTCLFSPVHADVWRVTDTVSSGNDEQKYIVYGENSIMRRSIDRFNGIILWRSSRWWW